MAQFDRVKNGYDASMVDNYISNIVKKYETKLSSLKDENVALQTQINNLTSVIDGYKMQEHAISSALTLAITKAEEIESNARAEGLDKISKIEKLYSECEEILAKMKSGDDKNKLLSSLKKIKENISGIESSLPNAKEYRVVMKDNSNNYIRNVLNRLDFVVNSNYTPEEVEIEGEDKEYNIPHDESRNRLKSIGGRLQNISKKMAIGTTLADRYLDSEIEDNNNAYFKNFAPSEAKSKEKIDSGAFDLNDVLNPKEDLDEIMSSFEFYDQKNDDKK